MIVGVVNAELEATLRLIVGAPSGQTLEIEAVVDTGFNGSLTLPAAIVSALGLPWLCRQEGELANGSLQAFDVHSANVLWDSQWRAVEIEAADADPLLGMELLRGHELRVRVAVGGEVTVAAMT